MIRNFIDRFICSLALNFLNVLTKCLTCLTKHMYKATIQLEPIDFLRKRRKKSVNANRKFSKSHTKWKHSNKLLSPWVFPILEYFPWNENYRRWKTEKLKYTISSFSPHLNKYTPIFETTRKSYKKLFLLIFSYNLHIKVITNI